MAEGAANGHQFEMLIKRLFEARGYRVRHQSGGGDFGVDLIATKADENAKLIQVKWANRPQVALRSLRDWAALTARSGYGDGEPVLIVSGFLEGSRREWAQIEFKVTILDRADLLRLSAGLTIKTELDELFGHSDGSPATAPVPLPESEILDQPPEEMPTQELGEALAKKLDMVPRGKTGAKRYEQVCEQIITYLFGDSLVDPRPQSRTDDKLNIVDIIFRVKAENSFWTALTRDFRARVIVFECKNYEGPIGPTQVYTTERYMSAAALRPICFVLSRTSAHDHARTAAQGALRETGKLLIFLDDVIIKRMLKERDAQIRGGPTMWSGNGPTEILDQEIYDFLATMPR